MVFPRSLTLSLHANSVIGLIYRNLADATISLKIVDHPLESFAWCDFIFKGPNTWYFPPKAKLDETARGVKPNSPLPDYRIGKARLPNYQETFACIATLETGLNVSPADLKSTYALSLDNSIYVLTLLLADPFEAIGEYAVTRVVGNIGYPGMCLMIAPQNPKTRSLLNGYNLVAHEDYNYQQEDNFKSTTLHLSFTDWTSPLLLSNDRRTVDCAIQYVEAVVSVREAGEWVADLNPLAIDFKALRKLPSIKQCPHSEDSRDGIRPKARFISLDCCWELLDPPDDGIGVFRAHKNWAARLAAVSVLCQQGHASNIVLCGPSFCWKCSLTAFSYELHQKYWIS